LSPLKPVQANFLLTPPTVVLKAISYNLFENRERRVEDPG
jgi:hypothetical protein